MSLTDFSKAFSFTPTSDAFTNPSYNFSSSIDPIVSNPFSNTGKVSGYTSQYSNPSTFTGVTYPSSSASASTSTSTGSKTNWPELLTGIGMAAEGIGNGIRAFRGEPPIPGALSRFQDAQRREREMQQLKELLGAMGVQTSTSPTSTVNNTVVPAGEEEKKEDEDSEAKNVEELVKLYTTDPASFRLAGSIFAKPLTAPMFSLS